jgi:hypothetical protein
MKIIHVEKPSFFYNGEEKIVHTKMCGDFLGIDKMISNIGKNMIMAIHSITSENYDDPEFHEGVKNLLFVRYCIFEETEGAEITYVDP